MTVFNLTTEQSYKLDIVGAEDAAGNLSGQITSNFTVAKPVVDDVKPAVSTSVTGNKLTLSFSEKVSKGSVKIDGTSVEAGDIVASEDQKTFTVDVQDAGFLNGKTFINSQVVVTDFKDMTGNAMNEAKFNATFTADTTAPEFVSASIKTAANGADDKILLTFNDEVFQGDLDNSTAELTLKVLDGVSKFNNNKTDLQNNATVDNIDYGYDVNGNGKIEGNENNVIAIDYDTEEKSSYTFELDGKVVEDFYGNKVTNTITFSATAPVYTSPPGEFVDQKNVDFANIDEQDLNNNDLFVRFTAPMNNSALVAANYTLGGKALPSGTTLAFYDNRQNVLVTLPQGSITANGKYVFTATNLKDVDGNTLVGGKISEELTLVENIVPVATKVTVSSSNKFSVDFSEAVSGTATNETVIVKVNGTTVTPQSMVVTGGDLVVTTANNFAMSDSITVEFKGSTLADTNGNTVKNGVVSK